MTTLRMAWGRDVGHELQENTITVPIARLLRPFPAVASMPLLTLRKQAASGNRRLLPERYGTASRAAHQAIDSGYATAPDSACHPAQAIGAPVSEIALATSNAMV